MSDAENEVLFTTLMRKATRKIHSVSDALVNAKFAISLRDEKVWGGGLFVFYHIFAYLEDAKQRLNMPDFNKLFVHEILHRKKAYEEDLQHYLGDDWQTTPKSKALENYLQHLQDLEKDNPSLLMAYVYHLYMGLLSGGQILAKKRRVFGEEISVGAGEAAGEHSLQQPHLSCAETTRSIHTLLTPINSAEIVPTPCQILKIMLYGFRSYKGTLMRLLESTCSLESSLLVLHNGTPTKDIYVDKVTDFSQIDISKLKTDFKNAMNEIAGRMTEEWRQLFIEESNQVFLMNNLVVDSVHGQNEVIRNMFFKASALALILVTVVMAYKMR